MPPKTVVRVALPRPLHHTLDYLAPCTDADGLRPGLRVQVPLGHKHVVGVIWEVGRLTTVPAARLRSITKVLDTEPLISEDQRALAAWASAYYHYPIGEVATLLFAPRLRTGGEVASRLRVWQLTPAGRAQTAAALIRAPAQAALWRCLHAAPEGLSTLAFAACHANYRPALRALHAKGWVESYGCAAMPTEPTACPIGPVLTPDQHAVLDALVLDAGYGTHVLQGVTGSGKTEIYLRAAAQILARGQQVLVLVPEIALTPQLLQHFRARLGTGVTAFHSALTETARATAWEAARTGTARVVIATRSGVLLPFSALRLIVIDEEHDPSYKQSDGLPYHARDLALIRARHLGIPVLLGSATPCLETLHNVQRGRYRLSLLPTRIGSAGMPHVEALDLRRCRLHGALSEPLIARMHAHLARDGQVLLFLNRRGYAPVLWCGSCGWSAACLRCHAGLVLHLKEHNLRCHHCGAVHPVPAACPVCGNPDPQPIGHGTQRIEQTLAEHFPGTACARLDRDATRRRGSLEAIVSSVHAGESRIVVGTQMLSKGHHFAGLTLVGILDADQGLYAADFRATERLAQLIIQVAGRAGRGAIPGEVLIQTRQPEHPVLQRLIHGGYGAFAEAALAERRAARLPPYTHLALLACESVAPAPALRFLAAARACALAHGATGVDISDPVPAPLARRAGHHRAQLLLNAARRTDLQNLLASWNTELCGLPSARQVRWSLDVDPYVID